MKRYLKVGLVFAALGVLFVSCSKEPAPDPQPKEVKVTGITVSSTSISLTEGETHTLTATISPSNADNKKVIWSSSDATIASVSDGTVTAVKEGTATITAKSDDGGKTATCQISVSAKAIRVEGISLDKERGEMVVGNECTLVATITPDNASNKKVYWDSSDPSVVTIEDGKVSAIKEGTAVITATTEDGGKTTTCQVTVRKDVFYVSFTSKFGKSLLEILDLNANLKYSTDGFSWKTCEYDQFIEIGNGTALYLRGIGNNKEGQSGSICNLHFYGGGRVYCSGNAMALLDSEQLGTEIKRTSCFEKLFSGSNNLVEAPDLPATTLSKGCYSNMFALTSLAEAPKLPATTLAEDCYIAMFMGCNSLVEAPELPATTLAKGCYNGMFGDCSQLSAAPKLPATTLAEDCYREMFRDCRSLVEAPKLPATTLAEGCYLAMFMGCNSLVEAPDLPATKLAEYCYCQMFLRCASLTKAPDLPAKTLAQSCYYGMFEGCTSLTKAPDLLAKRLVNHCYNHMFYGCKSLNYVKALFEMGLDPIYYVNDWLKGVSPTGTFVKYIYMFWDNEVIPDGWTVECVE